MRTLIITLAFIISIFIASCGGGGGGGGSTSTESSGAPWRFAGEEGVGMASDIGPISNYDLNGDGTNDVLIGIPYTELGGLGYVGRIVALDGETGAQLWETYGDGEFYSFGRYINISQDLNGDGIEDMLCGSGWPSNNGLTQNGAVRCISGKDGLVLWDSYGQANLQQLGWGSIEPSADFDGDAIQDFLCINPNSDVTLSNEGSVSLLSGATGTILWTVYGQSLNEEFGATFVVSDMNSDGTPDLVAGSPHADGAAGLSTGKITAISGLDGTQLWAVEGEQASMKLGTNLILTSDVDVLGAKDLFTSNPSADTNVLTNNGFMRALTGETGSTIWGYMGTNTDERIGGNPRIDRDHDGDGTKDVLTYSYQSEIGGIPQSGLIDLISGASGAQLGRYSGGVLDKVGTHLIRIDDVNGDSVVDYATSNSERNAGGFSLSGYIDIVSGADLTLIFRINGAANDARLGEILEEVDLDGDGNKELLSRSPYASVGLTTNGSLSLFDPATGVQIWAAPGAYDDSTFSLNTMIVDDVNSDGYQDLVVGCAYRSNNGFNDNGSIVMVSGKDGTEIWRRDGPADYSNYGADLWASSMHSFFDANGDGINDVLSTCGYASSTGLDSDGRMTLFSGDDGVEIWEKYGLESLGYLGDVTTEFPDIDNDGIADILDFSGYASTNGLGYTGRIEVISGATGERAE